MSEVLLLTFALHVSCFLFCRMRSLCRHVGSNCKHHTPEHLQCSLTMADAPPESVWAFVQRHCTQLVLLVVAVFTCARHIPSRRALPAPWGFSLTDIEDVLYEIIVINYQSRSWERL